MTYITQTTRPVSRRDAHRDTQKFKRAIPIFLRLAAGQSDKMSYPESCS